MNKSEQLELFDARGTIAWSSSDKSKVIVNSNGKITAKKPGKVTITAELNGKKYTCEVTVPVPTYKLDKTDMFIEKNNSKTLKLVDANGTIKWTSSDSSVASVNSKGKVTAKKSGKATITASFEGKKYTCKITIPDKVLAPMKITKIDSKEIYYSELLVSGDTEHVYSKTVNKNKLTSNTKYYVYNYEYNSDTYKLKSVSNKVFTKSFDYGYYTIY